MTIKGPSLQRISRKELKTVLSQIHDEKFSDLVLFGPKISTTSNLGLGEFKDFPLVFQLTDFVDNLGEQLLTFTNLTSLNLRGNRLGDADAQHLASLTNLTSLDLAHNQLGDDGARYLSSLTNLTSLKLGNNQLGESGARHLASLTNLTSLDLENNQLGDEGVRHLLSLTNLTSLNLWGNVLKDTSARHLASLPTLTSLDLGWNQLGADGVRHLASLTNLTSLNLWGNQIGDAGVRHLAGLSNLTYLNLQNNQLGDEGVRHLASLTNLTSLYLSNNQLGADGVRHLASLTNLTSLDLGINRLGETGVRHLANLTNLTSLDLSNNQLGADGVRHLASLTNLTSLYLGRTRLGEAGVRHLAGLTNLTFLDLWFNQLGEAGVRHLAHLIKLSSLNLRDNHLGDDGARHLAGLTNLTSLNLWGNQLGNKGAQHLAGLTNLTSLNLTKTSVSDLSPLIGLFKKGVPAKWDYDGDWGIFLRDCPLIHPPPEVVRQGHEAVLNYFREIERQGVDQLFEAKLLIVGEGRAGKTSLLRRLYQPDRLLPTEDETTKGIDICRYTFQLNNGRPFRLNVWDFGGQQIYHATHQFFLTKNSLYILLDDTAKDHKSVTDAGFRYWLEVIELLSNQSPVLIFQNEKGGRSKSIDEAGIKGRFPNVKEVYHGNLENPKSVEGLRQAIQYFVQQLPHIGEEVPAKWVAIRTAIEEEARQRPFMSQEEYFDLYSQHLELERPQALHLSHYFHDLGVFLHFQDSPRLRQTVILQNQWATEAVFTILDDETVKGQRGRFTLADCERLWTTADYGDKHLELLALMEKFELCYPLPDTHDTWLAPSLLSPSLPFSLEDWAQAGDLVLCYRYDFLPKGIINRLMVRMNRFVQRPDRAWESGVLFEQDETQVLAQATTDGNEIVLRARGPENKALLSVIASDLDALNARFKGLEDKLKKWVPCSCSQCRLSVAPEMFEQKRLLNRKRDFKLKVECPASYDEIGVLELLDGFKMDQFPNWMKKPSTAWPDESIVSPTVSPPPPKVIKIFLASSKELQEDRDAFDLYVRQQNDRMRKQGWYLEIVRWENSLDAMSNTRLQNEYNREVRACDIFVSLFLTKTGTFTEEEFEVAHQAFKKNGKPLIYTFFKNFSIQSTQVNREDLQTLWAFQDNLRDLGHFWTEYESIEHLKRQFRDQLDKLIDQGKLDPVTISEKLS